MSAISRLSARLPRELKLFIAASFVMGVAYAMVDSVFNNYINERFALSGFQRSFMEFPREFGGFVVVFVSALLWFFCSRRLGAVSMLLGMVGTLLIGFASPSYAIMVVWLFLYSLGQHLFLPISSGIGMELAREGQEGRRLGQLNVVRNISAITGALVVAAGFWFLGFTFHHAFAISACAFAVAAGLMFAMKPDKTQPPKMYLRLHREYRLYYVLAVLYGSRKQIFLTFAPWVLVTVFHQPVKTMATLYMAGGFIGIGFQPLLGWMIDRVGERFVLIGEAAVLVIVCFGYGFSRSILAEHGAFIVACACFLADGMLMSVNMARSTYMRKIARHPDHVQPALTSSVTIDHAFSITVALIGGVIWKLFGYQYVFLLGAFIAAANFIAALRVEVPRVSIAPAPVRQAAAGE